MLKHAKYLLILFTLILSNVQLSGQTFPLKISENGKYLITKKGVPIFLNATTYNIKSERHEKINLTLNRLGNYGFNAIVPEIHFPEPNNNKELTKKNKAFKKQIRQLKRLTREAAIMHMAVLISIPPDTNSLTDTVSLAAYPYYYYQLKQQLKQFKNIIWVHPADIHRETVANNPKQLNFKIDSDYTTGSSGDNLITIHNYEIPAKNHSQPAIYYLSTPQTITDSVKYEIRKKAYTKFLYGAAGFILVQPTYRSVSHSDYNLYNPVSVYLKQLKTLFDTLSWQNLQSGNINITDTQRNPVAVTAMIPDSSLTVIYLPSFTTFTIDLSVYNAPLKTIWINPVSGKSYKGMAFPANCPQIFFPPVTEENKDWLLILQTKP